MSYYNMSGLGRSSMRGYGEYFAEGTQGLGAYYSTHGRMQPINGFGAFGLIPFDGAGVWALFAQGGDAGQNATESIQAALNQLGYGPLTVDGQMGADTLSAWARFANDNNTGDATWPTQVGVLKLGDAVAAGGNPGGGPIIQQHIEDGMIVPGASPSAMSTGMMVGIGVAALAAIAAVVYVVKKKKSSSSSSSSYRAPAPRAPAHITVIDERKMVRHAPHHAR